MDEDYLLNGDEGKSANEKLYGQKRRERELKRWWQWSVGLLIFSAVFFVAGVAVWYRVNAQLKLFVCPKTEKVQQFEADREFHHQPLFT